MNTHMLLSDIIKNLSTRIADSGIEPHISESYAWWLLEKATGLNRAQLLARDTLEYTAHIKDTLDTMVRDLTHQNKPLAYILGTVPFGDLTLHVQPPTLIPRHETEEWVLHLAKKLQQTAAHEKLAILDLCTGSGCIALTLAAHLPHAHVWAVDIAPEALELAQKNAALNGIHNITLLNSDLFSALAPDMRFDLIVANPPYISHNVWETLDTSVTQWEDYRALVATKEGAAILGAIIKEAPSWLRSNEKLKQAGISHLMLEIGYDQGDTIRALFEREGYEGVRVLQDAHGKDRVVTGSKPYVAIQSVEQ